jgi:zinc protease
MFPKLYTMKNRLYIRKFSISLAALVLTAFSVFAQAQTPAAPRQEKLLNGLKILMRSDAQASNVSVKIRVHSGAAFDPQGKEGVMRMLAENIFPNNAVREFFTDDLGGSLEVVTNYDFIQINATAKPEEFLNLLETLANAVARPTIDKETTLRLRALQIEKVREMEKNPVYVADLAVAKGLFGTFPYGRPIDGSVESIQKIDFADLIFAKDRFFTADNATVTITGNFKPDLAFRAARRYFGAWAKSDGRIASTFPTARYPDVRLTRSRIALPNKSEFRIASRFARNDADFYAARF